MENASASLCTDWNEEYPGEERYDFCISMITQVLLFGPLPSEFIETILKTLSKIVELCDIIYVESPISDYMVCSKEYGRAFGYCEMVITDTNSTDFWECFHTVKRFETANPETVVTKWRFCELYCNRNRSGLLCDEYRYVQDYAFSLETRYLCTPFNDYYYRYILPALGTVTFITNGVILFILSAHMSTNCNIVLLRVKSISDTLVVIFQVPMLLYFVTFQTYTDFIPYHLCILIFLLVDILPPLFHSVSVFTGLGIAIQKFIIISFPLKAAGYLKPKNAYLYSVLCISISLTVLAPSVLVLCNTESIEIQSKNVYDKDITTMLMAVSTETDKEWMAHVNGLSFLLRTIILQCLPCFLLLGFESIGIRRTIRYIKTNILDKPPGADKVMQVVHMSLANVCIFFAAELPNTIALLYYSISEIGLSQNTLQKREMDLIGTILDALTWLSAVSNLFVCILCCRKFRAACLDLVRCSMCQ